MNVIDTTLASLAAARLSRLVITDDLGVWWVQTPAFNLIRKHSRPIPFKRADPDAPTTYFPPWAKYVGGVDCPWCIGFWLGAGVVATHPLWKRPGLARGVVTALALNYVVAHLGTRLGDFDIVDDDAPDAQ